MASTAKIRPPSSDDGDKKTSKQLLESFDALSLQHKQFKLLRAAKAAGENVEEVVAATDPFKYMDEYLYTCCVGELTDGAVFMGVDFGDDQPTDMWVWRMPVDAPAPASANNDGGSIVGMIAKACEVEGEPFQEVVVHAMDPRTVDFVARWTVHEIYARADVVVLDELVMGDPGHYERCVNLARATKNTAHLDKMIDEVLESKSHDDVTTTTTTTTTSKGTVPGAAATAKRQWEGPRPPPRRGGGGGRGDRDGMSKRSATRALLVGATATPPYTDDDPAEAGGGRGNDGGEDDIDVFMESEQFRDFGNSLEGMNYLEKAYAYDKLWAKYQLLHPPTGDLFHPEHKDARRVRVMMARVAYSWVYEKVRDGTSSYVPSLATRVRRRAYDAVYVTGVTMLRLSFLVNMVLSYSLAFAYGTRTDPLSNRVRAGGATTSHRSPHTGGSGSGGVDDIGTWVAQVVLGIPAMFVRADRYIVTSLVTGSTSSTSLGLLPENNALMNFVALAGYSPIEQQFGGVITYVVTAFFMFHYVMGLWRGTTNVFGFSERREQRDVLSVHNTHGRAMRVFDAFSDPDLDLGRDIPLYTTRLAPFERTARFVLRTLNPTKTVPRTTVMARIQSMLQHAYSSAAISEAAVVNLFMLAASLAMKTDNDLNADIRQKIVTTALCLVLDIAEWMNAPVMASEGMFWPDALNNEMLLESTNSGGETKALRLVAGTASAFDLNSSKGQVYYTATCLFMNEKGEFAKEENVSVIQSPNLAVVKLRASATNEAVSTTTTTTTTRSNSSGGDTRRRSTNHTRPPAATGASSSHARARSASPFVNARRMPQARVANAGATTTTTVSWRLPFLAVVTFPL